MKVLVDTNVLLRAFDKSQPTQQHIALQALWNLRVANHDLLMSAQNIAEFWNVSTRPASARGGYGLPIAVVEKQVQLIENFFEIVPFSRRAYRKWRSLVLDLQVTGVAVHHARIAASMMDAKITQLLTYNGADFRRYTDLTVLDPATVATGQT